MAHHHHSNHHHKKLHERIEDAQHKVQETAANVQEKAVHLHHDVQEKATAIHHDVQEKAAHLHHDVQEKAEHLHHHVQQKEVEIQKQVQRNVEILTRRETIKYMISCVLFGSLVFSTRHIHIGALQSTFLRVMVGAFFLLILFACSKFRATLWDYTKSQLIYLVVSGVCIGVNYLIISDASSKLGVTTVILTYSLGPGLLLIVAPFLFKDVHITFTKVLGFLICSVGVLLLDYEFLKTPHTFGVIQSVFVAACFTVVIVYCNRKLENIVGLENAMFQMIVAFLVILVIYVWKHGFYFEVPYPDSWWVVIAGTVHTGLPVYLYLSSIDDLRADVIAFAGYIRPLTSILISVFIFGDQMSTDGYVGAAFILGGVLMANIFRRKKLGKTRTF